MPNLKPQKFLTSNFMSQLTIAQTAKEQIASRSEERFTMAAMLNGIQAEIQLNYANDPRGTTLFIKNKQFRKAFRIATGWKGSLTALGFDLIRDQAKKDLNDATNSDGYPCETKLVLSPWGRLFASIVRTLALQFGEAHCISYLNNTGGSATYENDSLLAMTFAERLVVPQRNQMGIRRSIVQWTLERDLNNNQILAYIKNIINGQCSDYYESVNLDRKASPFKQVCAVEEFVEQQDAYLVADPTNLAADIRERSAEKHVVDNLCSALSDLPADLKPVMVEWIKSVREPDLSSKRTFHGQIEGIGARLGLSRRKAKTAADEIIKSLQQSLGVVVQPHETEAWVPKSKATACRMKRGELPLRPSSADFIRKDVRDDRVVDGRRLENADTMNKYGHEGFEVGQVLTIESSSGSGISAEVLTSDVEDLFKIFFNRNAPFTKMLNALD